MADLLIPKPIHCRQCDFEGKSLVQGTGCLWRLLVLALILGGIYFWPLFILVGLILVYLFFKPARHFCPKCGSNKVVALEQYRKDRGAEIRTEVTDQQLLSKPGEPITPENPEPFVDNKPIKP